MLIYLILKKNCNLSGILLFEMFHKKAPFKGRRARDVKAKIQTGKIMFRKDLDPAVQDLVKSMLQINPRRRPSVAQILQSPFIQSIKAKIKSGSMNYSDTYSKNKSKSIK